MYKTSWIPIYLAFLRQLCVKLVVKKGRDCANEERQKRERLWICSPMNSHVVNHIVRRMAPTRKTNITAITKYFLQLYILCK